MMKFKVGKYYIGIAKKYVLILKCTYITTYDVYFDIIKDTDTDKSDNMTGEKVSLHTLNLLVDDIKVASKEEIILELI